MKDDSSKKISESLLMMSQKKPKKNESIASIIQENKKIIEKLKKMNYSYIDIASFLNDQGIKISSNQIGKAIRNIKNKKTTEIRKEKGNKKENKSRHITTSNDADIFKKVSIEN